MRSFLPILIFTITFLSCRKENETPLENLNLLTFTQGEWVEKTKRMDTIKFDQDLNSNGSNFFIFKSANEIEDYNNLFSTIYEFKVKENIISLNNTISSCYCFSDYSLDYSGDKLMIGNFYNPGSKGVMETFVKLE